MRRGRTRMRKTVVPAYRHDALAHRCTSRVEPTLMPTHLRIPQKVSPNGDPDEKQQSRWATSRGSNDELGSPFACPPPPLSPPSPPFLLVPFLLSPSVLMQQTVTTAL